MALRDDDWFEALFRDHVSAVGRYARRRVDPSDVDDITAETFTIAWRRRLDVPEGAELPWLYRTCGFLIANHRRAKVPTPVEAVADSPDDLDPELAVLRDEQVREALLALSPRDRQIVLLHAWDGLAGEDLAAYLGITRGGADAALSRARARLREVWAGVQEPTPS